MRILVTGATGFFGRAIMKSLAERQIEAIGVSRRRPEQPVESWRHWDAMDHVSASAIVDDVRPTHIIHAAWTVEHGKFWTEPANTEWISATLALAKAAQKHGCQNFIGIGTCFEYRWPDSGACDETTTPVESHTLYDTCKDATRRVLANLLSRGKCRFVWTRPFNLYGIGEPEGRLITSIARAMATGAPAPCSSGQQVRDFIEISDAARAITEVALGTVEGPVNIGTGIPVTIADVARSMGRISGRPDLIKLGALPDRGGDPPYIVAGMKRLQGEVGFVPGVPLEKGLTDVLAYWKDRS